MSQILRQRFHPSTEQLIESSAETIATSAYEAIAQRGAFHLVLAGGNTPQAIYQQLRQIQTDWSKWFIYFGDERCLPTGDQERNDLMAEQNWLNQVSIPKTQIYNIPAEKGAELAAKEYSELLSNLETFDLVLLGLGEDGHTASLFPEHELGSAADASACLAVSNAPKPPADRVSLSAQRLSQTRQLIFIVSGKGKQDALRAWQAGAAIPAAAIAPECGVDVYMDMDAAV
ncbi:MAG: 6-phosphogluconolactonase [Gammaproteobacteria bacterium]|nr:6-phosphogluconolactonase [Gammaproteobacteria bacterium]